MVSNAFWKSRKMPAAHSPLSRAFLIQIKIYAEYRDMLPRPRLVCQEPGLRPIGRSPGVPDKSSRGLGSMSRYSAQILICFIAYIFSIFNFSVGLVGNLAELPPCTVPPATVHCYQNEAAQCSSDNQISQHALLRGSRKKHSLAFMPQNWWNQQIKWMKYVSAGSFQYRSQVNEDFYCIPVSSFTVFQPRIQTDFRSVGCFENLLGQEFDSCQTTVKLEFESLFRANRYGNNEIWRYNVDLRPKLHILSSLCSLIFNVISSTDSMDFWNASGC